MTFESLPSGIDMDEGFDEQKADLEALILSSSEEQRADLALQLLLSLSPNNLSQLLSKVEPLLQKDFVSLLPNELSLYIFSLTDVKTLGRVAQVNHRWNQLSQDNIIWKHLYSLQKGYRYNEKKLLSLLQQNNSSKEQKILSQVTSNQESSFENISHQAIPRQRLIPTATASTSTSTFTSQNTNSSRVVETPTNSIAGAVTSVGGVGMMRFSFNPISINPNTSTIATSEMPALSPLSPITNADTSSSAFTGVRANLSPLYSPSLDEQLSRLQIHSDGRSLASQAVTKSFQKDSIWKYMFRQRSQLDRNWQVGKYELHELTGHEEGVYCIQFDDDKVISGSRDDTIKVWDLRREVCVRTFYGHRASVLCLQYDNERIISGGSDTLIIIWQLGTGRILQTLRGHTESVLSLRFDSKYIISCSKDKTIRVWKLATGECLKILHGHLAAVNSVQFLNDIIVSASGDRTIKIWNVETGECLNTLTGHTRGIACVQYDGVTIVSGSSDKTIKVWSVETGACLQTLTGHTELVRTVQFNDSWIVSGSYDETVKIWDRKTGQALVNLSAGGHRSKVFNIQFNDTHIVSCSHDQRILLWNFSNNIDMNLIQ